MNFLLFANLSLGFQSFWVFSSLCPPGGIIKHYSLKKVQNIYVCKHYIVTRLDGRNRAIVFAESLARVVVAIRIASVRWRSYLP